MQACHIEHSEGFIIAATVFRSWGRWGLTFIFANDSLRVIIFMVKKIYITTFYIYSWGI